jgi:hypothetical protein
MMRFDGTLARQLDLIDIDDQPRTEAPRPAVRPARRNLRLLKEDVYAEIVRRRRRAQIAARHALK